MGYFSGRVSSVIHENQAQSFYILKVVLDDPSVVDFSDYLNGNVTIRGSIPGMAISSGSWLGFEAQWTEHKSFGRQLAISRAPVVKKTWDPMSAESAMAAHGVSERVMQQVRSHVGDDKFVESLSNLDVLVGVPGVTNFVAMHITQRWGVVQAYFRSLGFLNDLGLPSGKIGQVWSTFGDDSEEILSSNPWELIRIDGISFQQADEIAIRLGLNMDNPNRLRGVVMHVCKNQRSFGHMYMGVPSLLSEATSIFPDISREQFASTLASAHRDGVVVLDRETNPSIRAVYDPWSYKMEVESARMLSDRVTKASVTSDEDDYIKKLGSAGPVTEGVAKSGAPLLEVVEAAVEEWGKSTNLVLSTAQHQGVINALHSPVSILTGLPGTGKTTCLVAVVSILKDMGIPYLLCAPTGIAAKNLGSKTGARASTIHRSFSAKGKYGNTRDSNYSGISGSSSRDSGSERDEEWGYDHDNPHPARVVIVDEASMLDQHLIYRLTECTSETCRMVIVGDAAQLPSVGPGNVLRDVIKSGKFPVVHLTEIFRQKDTSGIVYAAHSIYRGEMPDTTMPDFTLIPVTGDDKVSEVVIRAAVRLNASNANFQVLSPRHAGPVGVTNLNYKIRELLNPGGQGSQEINVGDSTIREGDRVMVVKNNYELGVFNGDVGKVSRIDRKAKTIDVKVYGDPVLLVQVPFKDVGSLIRLAYACTVHKSQGLEYDVIVMPVVESFNHQLQRNLLYTAVTRAKKRVILVGSMNALGTAVINDREDQRNTLFGDRISAVDVSGCDDV